MNHFDQLSRIEKKVDVISAQVTELVTTTKIQQHLIERNTVDLEDHMARTEANEELIEQARGELRDHRVYIKAFHKYTAFCLAALGGAATIARLLGAI